LTIRFSFDLQIGVFKIVRQSIGKLLKQQCIFKPFNKPLSALWGILKSIAQAAINSWIENCLNASNFSEFNVHIYVA